jgi:hypothetical protein
MQIARYKHIDTATRGFLPLTCNASSYGSGCTINGYDSPEGRARYGRCFATVEPVFGNLRHNKQLNRFTLRGQKKVDAQWKLYCLVHNIEKLAHHGYAQ